MTDVDELLSRSRRLEPIRLEGEYKAAVQQRARQRVRGTRPAPAASLALLGTVVVYLGWALHFTSALYR